MISAKVLKCHQIEFNGSVQTRPFFKFYIQSLYKTKGDTQQNIQVRNDEDLEIDLMFISVKDNG